MLYLNEQFLIYAYIRQYYNPIMAKQAAWNFYCSNQICIQVTIKVSQLMPTFWLWMIYEVITESIYFALPSLLRISKIFSAAYDIDP